MHNVSMYDILVRIAKSKDTNPDYLMLMVQRLRPIDYKNTAYAVDRFNDLIFILEKDEYLLSGLRTYIHRLLKNRKFSSLIADLGIISSGGFRREIFKRFYHKILPIQPAENSMEYLATNIFYHRKDHRWFSALEEKSWRKFFDLLNIKPLSECDNDSFAVNEVLFSIDLLALRISGTAMDYSLLRMLPEYAGFDSPFISLQKDISVMIESFKTGTQPRTEDDINVKQVRILIKQCKDYLTKALGNKDRYGINFFTTIKFVRLQQQLDRLEMLLNYLIDNKEQKDTHIKTVHFLNQIIRLNAKKNNIREFWRTSTNLVAYQITQHTGTTGEHYITENRSEYKKMFYSAAGGGVVVGFLCIFKAQLSNIDTSLFGQAFLYSINYALGFIAIYLFHFTLATKQPAMTAATLAKALKPEHKGSVSYSNFADLFARLFRSQFIAFVGNVFLAFPVAIGLFLIWKYIFGSDFLTVEHSRQMLDDVNFIKSKAIPHAALTGVFLFLSGLISGYYINRNIHDRISLRIRKHPILRKFFPDKSLDKFASIYDKHIGGIAGNFWFGVMLGTTGTIGVFFGLDLGIRHITFAAGNFGLALLGLNFNITIWDILIAVLCIGLIGFFNFIVSFVLSMFVALRSRNLRLFDIKPIFFAIWTRFKQSKRDFFLPPPKKVYAIREESESIIEENRNES
ncbi:MAG: site-specific recombinase [Bacteroidia bacterium]|nr:site-specific recombinase [Bacteroidia bacterium]MCO5252804.1 site-specific recombinase [Bacteroidota bacterium]